MQTASGCNLADHVLHGKWVQYYDALHYITGITQSNSGELMVSWSMSHFDADTLIRIHRKNVALRR